MEHTLNAFEDIVRSKESQHISIYLRNDSRFRAKTQYYADQIQRILLRHHSLDETKKLVKPIYSVFKDRKTISSLGENIAVFKKRGYLRLLTIPHKVQEMFVLANTFHVKPILSMQQNEVSGTLIYCEKDAVKLIEVNSLSSPLVSEFRLSHIVSELSKYDDYKISTSYFMLSKQLLINWLDDSFRNKSTTLERPVFIYGEKTMASFLAACIKSVTKSDLAGYKESFHPNAKEAVLWGRSQILKMRKLNTEEKVRDFSLIKENEFISHDIQEILYNLLAGNVKKLMVSKDQSIFGKIDRLSGKITFTHFHKDHEDDDLLDDIAQIAIDRGIQPIMARQGQIRKQRLIKAVVEKRPQLNDRLAARRKAERRVA